MSSEYYNVFVFFVFCCDFPILRYRQFKYRVMVLKHELCESMKLRLICGSGVEC